LSSALTTAPPTQRCKPETTGAGFARSGFTRSQTVNIIGEVLSMFPPVKELADVSGLSYAMGVPTNAEAEPVPTPVPAPADDENDSEFDDDEDDDPDDSDPDDDDDDSDDSDEDDEEDV